MQLRLSGKKKKRRKEGKWQEKVLTPGGPTIFAKRGQKKKTGILAWWVCIVGATDRGCVATNRGGRGKRKDQISKNLLKRNYKGEKKGLVGFFGGGGLGYIFVGVKGEGQPPN